MFDKAIHAKLDLILASNARIETALNTNKELIMTQASDLAALQAQVTANTNAEAAAVQLIQGIASQIAAAGNDSAQLEALTQQLQSSAQALGAAITANTPSAAGGTPQAGGAGAPTGQSPVAAAASKTSQRP